MAQSPELVVVSNRLPFSIERHGDKLQIQRSAGGLVAALEPVLNQRGGVWVGWAGVSQQALDSAGGLNLPGGAVTYRAVPLSGHEVSLYYAGFSNRTIWPLFHYFVGDTTIDGGTWRAYEQVNERFAQVAVNASAKDTLIWVHDYQLLRVPHHVRRLAPDRRIAFFLHIPFPAPDVLRVLPWSRNLIRGMLAADLVGFHIPAYAEHFLLCAERLLGSEVDHANGIVRFEGREVSVQSHPISIDVAHIEALAGSPGREPGAPEDDPERVREILGVDRLDYTKGVNERLLGIERLLDRHAEYRGRILFTQLLVPSRERVPEYNRLKREIDETVGRINGRFSAPDWSPIRYLARTMPPEELVPLYRKADIALVTPLRDGMNLVAKEYVAAQLENNGVLIVSEMAGAAEELQEALIVNPFDIDAVADALDRALSMPDDERRARMSALRDRVRTRDVHAWVRGFLESAEAAAVRARAGERLPSDHVRRRLVPWLAQRPTVALFLDYDGTLTPIVARPEDAQLSEATRQTLEQAAKTPNLDVVIVSGRALDDIQTLVGVPGLTYVANHGFETEGPGLSFRHAGTSRFLDALNAAAADLIGLGIEGALIERKGPTVAYHVRNVAEELREDAERQAEQVFKKHRLYVTKGKCVIDGRPAIAWDKGQAVLHVLVQRHGADWPSKVRALYIGDDTTDEDAFRTLRGIGRSICVGHSPQTSTLADFRLADPEAVLQLLRWLASGAFAEAKA